MRKVIVILLIMSLSIACLIAKPFEINLGLSGTYNKGYNEIIEGEKPQLGDFSFGAATDVKLLFADIDANALYTKNGDESILNGVVSANLALDILFIRVKAGIGYDYFYNITTGDWAIAGSKDLKDLLACDFYLRGEVDVLLGSLQAGVFMTYPVEMPVVDFFSNIREVQWDRVLQGATFGFTVKICLI